MPVQRKRMVQVGYAGNATASGNPRYTVHFSDGTAANTKPDAALNWGIENPENWGEADWEFDNRGFLIYVSPITVPVFVDSEGRVDFRRSFADYPGWRTVEIPYAVFQSRSYPGIEDYIRRASL